MFISTNIDYVLRNLGVRSLIVAGVLTDQCIDSAVRDACDLGYLVTVPTDACATLSAERHEWALRNNRGYCRQITRTLGAGDRPAVIAMRGVGCASLCRLRMAYHCSPSPCGGGWGRGPVPYPTRPERLLRQLDQRP